MGLASIMYQTFRWHRQHNCLGCLNPVWYWMESPRQMDPNTLILGINQGWNWAWIDPLGSNFLGSSIITWDACIQGNYSWSVGVHQVLSFDMCWWWINRWTSGQMACNMKLWFNYYEESHIENIYIQISPLSVLQSFCKGISTTNNNKMEYIPNFLLICLLEE